MDAGGNRDRKSGGMPRFKRDRSRNAAAVDTRGKGTDSQGGAPTQLSLKPASHAEASDVQERRRAGNSRPVVCPNRTHSSQVRR